MDEITLQLRKEGLVPRSACLPGCGLLLGMQIEWYPYNLVYRIDENNLILCNFYRMPNSQAQPSSLVGLWRVLCNLFQRVKWLRAIRMMVITDVWDRQLARLRQRLVRLLYKMGAVRVLYNGECWLEIVADTLCNHRKRSSGATAR